MVEIEEKYKIYEKRFGYVNCIAISPGARNVINGNPNAPPLSLPMAKESTIKKSKEVTSGEIIV